MRSTFRLSLALLFSVLLVAQAAAQTPPTIAGAPAAAPTAGASAPAKAKPMRDPALYKAEVTMTSESASERQGAIARALLQVLVKLTGNAQVGSNPVVRRSLSSASAMVATASTAVAASDSEGNTAIGGVPVVKTTLEVSFDPGAVDALIASAGLKYWTGARPKPMLWLAIDDGRGPRLVTGQQLNVVKPLATRGVERGVRFLLPAGNAAEQSAVDAIWAQNSAAMQAHSARYGNDAQLLGKVYRSPGGWNADWVLTQDAVELARWSFSDADPRRAIASGADTTADAIAARDTVRLDIGPAGLYTVDIAGVDNQRDFLRLMRYLQALAMVRKLSVLEATPDHLRVQMDLNIGLKGFRNAVEAGGVLNALSEVETGEATPEPSRRIPRFGLRTSRENEADSADR